MKKLSAVFIFCLLFTLSYGQKTISGIVKAGNGQALIGATILEKATDQNNASGTVSNIDGTFELLTTADTILVLYVGYLTKEVVVRKDEYLTIVLDVNTTLGPGLSVIIYEDSYTTERESTNTLSPRSRDIVTASTSDILNTVPGLHMQSGGYNTNKLTIRGIGSRSQFSTSSVKTFYNNIPLHSLIGESAIEDIGLHMADKVEVVKGVTGTKLESGYGGAIMIKNKNIQSINDTVITSDNTISKWGHLRTQNQVMIGRSDNRNSHNLSIYHSYLTDDGYRANNQFDRSNYTLNYTFNKGGKLKLTTLLNHVGLKAFIPSSLSREDYDEEPTKAAFTWNRSMGNEEYTKTLAGLNIDYELHSESTLSHTFYGQLFESSELRPFNTIDEESVSIGVKGNYKINWQNEEVEFGYRIQNESYDYSLFETETNIKGEKFGDGSEDRTVYELYGQFRNSISDHWSYLIGLNTQYVSISAEENKVLDRAFLLPEAVVTYRAHRGTRIYGKVGKGVNYFGPSDALMPDGTYNTDLLPSSAWNVSLGSKGRLFNNRLSYRVEAYKMWESDIITTQRDATNQSILSNNGSASYLGGEANLQYLLIGKERTDSPKLYLNLDFAQMSNVYTDYKEDDIDYSGNRIPGSPQQTLLASINGMAGGFLGNMRYNSVSAFHMRDDNSIQSDPYQLWHATIGYKLEMNGWKITPRIDFQNIANEKYASMTLVNASSFGGNAPRYYYAGRPRHVMYRLCLEYKL